MAEADAPAALNALALNALALDAALNAALDAALNAALDAALDAAMCGCSCGDGDGGRCGEHSCGRSRSCRSVAIGSVAIGSVAVGSVAVGRTSAFPFAVPTVRSQAAQDLCALVVWEECEEVVDGCQGCDHRLLTHGEVLDHLANILPHVLGK